MSTTIFNNSRANNLGVTKQISLIIELIRYLVPINTLCNFGPDWLRNVVSVLLKSFKTTIFNNSMANNFRVTRRILLITELMWDLVPINTLCNFGPDWQKCGLYCTDKIKNSIVQSFRANNSEVTGWISLTIELIRDFVPLNTSCIFGPDWQRNVPIVLTKKS